MMKYLYLMCGPAGCGKSTYIRNEIKYNHDMCKEIGDKPDSICISRDKIRFSMLSDEDDYFSKEREVFEEFINKINSAIKNPRYNYIYVDATHLTPSSRNKTLNRLNINENLQIVAVNIMVDEETCVRQNALRSGHALVPETVVRKMCRDFIPATEKENDKIFLALNVGREGEFL